MKQRYDIELHNEIRWLIEDYVGEFNLKRELVDRIIEKIKEAVIKDVEQLEQQNKQLLDELIRCYKEMDHIDEVCEIANVHPFDLMRSSLKNIIESITGKKLEEL